MKESERKTETDGGRIAEWSKRLLQKDNPGFDPQQQETKNEREIEQSKRSKMKKKQRE